MLLPVRQHLFAQTQREGPDPRTTHSSTHGSRGARHHPHCDHAEDEEEAETRGGAHLHAQQQGPESRRQLPTGKLPPRGLPDAALRHHGVPGEAAEEPGEVRGEGEAEQETGAEHERTGRSQLGI